MGVISMRRLVLKQSHRLHIGICLFLLLVAGSVYAFELKDCEIPGLKLPARCGTYEVFENRKTRQGRKIPINVVLVPATGESSASDPVVFFAGGPGASTVEMAADTATFRVEDLKSRDFLFIDYRGTGKSYPLYCPYQEAGLNSIQDALEHFIKLDAIPECLEVLSQKADLRQYHTPNIVDDISEVITALGYEQVNLWGGSYGTRAAMSFVRRHPEQVRTATLEGVAPHDARIPASFSADAQDALDGWLRVCRDDKSCAKAFPSLTAELESILQQVSTTPQYVTVDDPRNNTSVEMKLTRNVIVQTLRYMLYVPNSVARLPAFVHAAAEGDWQPLGQTAFFIGQSLLSGIPDGLYLSVTCTEDVAYIGPNAAAIQRGFMGDFRLRQQQTACKDWPKGELPDNFFDPIVSDKPILIISGEFDPVTPARFGYQVQEYFTNGQHLVVPYGAHATFGLKNAECLDQLQSELLNNGSVIDLDIAGCREQIQPPAFQLKAKGDEAITLTQEEMQAFVGEYTNEEKGFSISFTLDEKGILADIGGQTFYLVPTRKHRLALASASPGDYMDFHTDDTGNITSLSIYRNGEEQLLLMKQ